MWLYVTYVTVLLYLQYFRQSGDWSECVSYSIHDESASFFVKIHSLCKEMGCAEQFVRLAHNFLTNKYPGSAWFAFHIIEKNDQDLQPTSNELFRALVLHL